MTRNYTTYSKALEETLQMLDTELDLLGDMKLEDQLKPELQVRRTTLETLAGNIEWIMYKNEQNEVGDLLTEI